MSEALELNGANWRDEAICRTADPNIFFPEDGDKDGEKKAVEICKQCPVANQCLDFALLKREKSGIWGGKTERERRRILRARGAGKRTLQTTETVIEPVLD